MTLTANLARDRPPDCVGSGISVQFLDPQPRIENPRGREALDVGKPKDSAVLASTTSAPNFLIARDAEDLSLAHSAEVPV